MKDWITVSSDSSDDLSEHKDTNCITDSVADSAFFKLLPELRNTIYSLALTENHDVHITKQHGIPEHPVLSACKTIRSEASGIFYGENTFWCVVESFDCSAPQVYIMKPVKGCGKVNHHELKAHSIIVLF